jgi:hypothetical protein
MTFGNIRKIYVDSDIGLAIIRPSLWLVIAPTHTLQLVLVDTSKDFPEIRSLEVSALRQHIGS